MLREKAVESNNATGWKWQAEAVILYRDALLYSRKQLQFWYSTWCAIQWFVLSAIMSQLMYLFRKKYLLPHTIHDKKIDHSL
jgi:hypothetical protein